MTRRLVLGVALSTRSWRGALQRHCRDHEADVVVTLLRDGFDAAVDGLDVVVLDDDTSWLSVPLLDRLRSAGVVVVGLFDPEEADGHGARHLQRLGVDAIVSSAVPVEDLVDRIRAVAPEPEQADRFAEQIAAADAHVPAERRQVLTVGGPAGAGATEVSIALTQLWGGIRPLLIEVDETHPSLARRLGLTMHPHVVTAVEAHRGERIDVDGRSRESVEDCLARPALGQPPLPFDVISGLASRDDWSLLRADDVVRLLDDLAARWPVVVVRLGSSLEDLSRHVGRHDVSRAAAGRATRIIGVCDASPVGLLRFVDWLVDVVSVAAETPIDVVINRAPTSAARRDQIVTQLHKIAGDRIGDVVLAPHDKRVERAAWDAGLVDRGGFVKAIAGLPLESSVVAAA